MNVSISRAAPVNSTKESAISETASALPKPAAICTRCCAASALFQRIVQIRFGRLKRRSETEEDASQKRSKHSEAQSPAVQENCMCPRQIRRRQRQEQVESPVSKEQSQCTSENGEQQTFCEQLAGTAARGPLPMRCVSQFLCRAQPRATSARFATLTQAMRAQIRLRRKAPKRGAIAEGNHGANRFNA